MQWGPQISLLIGVIIGSIVLLGVVRLTLHIISLVVIAVGDLQNTTMNGATGGGGKSHPDVELVIQHDIDE